MSCKYLSLVLLAVLVAGCACSRDVVVGSWSNGLSGQWSVTYVFYENGTVTYHTGAHSGHDALLLVGEWNNMGRVNDPGGVSGVYYTLFFPGTSTSPWVGQNLCLKDDGTLVIVTSDGVVEPRNTVLNKT